MKPLLICLCLLILSVSALAQNLSFSALLNLRKMQSPAAVDRKLSKKGWTLMSDNKPTDTLTGVATWAYKPEGRKALAWVEFYYSNSDTRFNVIEYNPDCNCTMSKFEKAVKAQRMIYLNRGDLVKEGELIHKYKAFYNSAYVVRLLTYPTQENRIGIQIFNVNYYLSTIQGNDYL